jgi:hypothetical protein
MARRNVRASDYWPASHRVGLVHVAVDVRVLQGVDAFVVAAICGMVVGLRPGIDLRPASIVPRTFDIAG